MNQKEIVRNTERLIGKIKGIKAKNKLGLAPKSRFMDTTGNLLQLLITTRDLDQRGVKLEDTFLQNACQQLESLSTYLKLLKTNDRFCTLELYEEPSEDIANKYQGSEFYQLRKKADETFKDSGYSTPITAYVDFAKQKLEKTNGLVGKLRFILA